MFRNVNVLLILSLSLNSWAWTERPVHFDSQVVEECRSLASQVYEGDLIFTEIDNPLYRRVARVSGGWASHVGVVFQDNGQWMVYESRPPRVTRTKLCDFLARSVPGRVSLSRWRRAAELDRSKIARMKDVARRQFRVRYDPWFDYDARRSTFCSKYVDSIYREALGESTGQVETLRELLANLKDSPFAVVDLRFWRAWFFGRIPWQQRTLSPHSQWTDEDFSSYYDAQL